MLLKYMTYASFLLIILYIMIYITIFNSHKFNNIIIHMYIPHGIYSYNKIPPHFNS